MRHQMLGQIRGHDHPPAVVHGARHIHLAHGGIDKGDARPPLLPRLHLWRDVGVPREGVPILFPVVGQDARRVMRQMIGKFAPDQFFQEHLGIALAVLQGAFARVPAEARADLAEGEVFGQVRGAFDPRQVAAFDVIAHAVRNKGIEPVARRLLAHGAMAGQNVGCAVHRFAQLPVGQIVAGRPCLRRGDRGRARQRFGHVITAHGVPHGRIDLVEPARFGLNRPRLEQQMASKTARFDPVLFQRGFHACVAVIRRRMIEPRPIDRPCPRFPDQIAQHVERRTLAQDQLAALRCQSLAKLRQGQIKPQFLRAAQGRHLIVVDIDGDDRPPAIAGGGQGGMVGKPQVAAEPDDNRCLCHST